MFQKSSPRQTTRMASLEVFTTRSGPEGSGGLSLIRTSEASEQDAISVSKRTRASREAERPIRGSLRFEERVRASAAARRSQRADPCNTH